jgi:hypothetical protein
MRGAPPVTDLVTHTSNGDKPAWDALVDQYARSSEQSANGVLAGWLRLPSNENAAEGSGTGAGRPPCPAASYRRMPDVGNRLRGPRHPELTLWGPGVRPDPLSCSAR